MDIITNTTHITNTMSINITTIIHSDTLTTTLLPHTNTSIPIITAMARPTHTGTTAKTLSIITVPGRRPHLCQTFFLRLQRSTAHSITPQATIHTEPAKTTQVTGLQILR